MLTGGKVISVEWTLLARHGFRWIFNDIQQMKEENNINVNYSIFMRGYTYLYNRLIFKCSHLGCASFFVSTMFFLFIETKFTLNCG